jgi:phosphinothricin acetyltransferase
MLLIRDAERKDAASIADIYNEAITNSTATFDTELKSVDDRIAWLEQHNHKYPVVVAELDGNVIGYASLTRWSDRCAYDDTAEISIYIHPDYRGKGTGRMLMESVLEKGKAGGLHCVLSRITQGNEISIHLHEKFGFTTVGVLREVGKKFGQLLDVTMMQLLYEN